MQPSSSPRGPELLTEALKGRTQQQEAQKLKVHQSTLSRWASAKQEPDIDDILRMRDEYGIPVEAWATGYTPRPIRRSAVAVSSSKAVARQSRSKKVA